MLANKFIDLLEAEKLLDPEMIEELRRQVSQAGSRLSVETLAKLLVDNEQLTKFQATRLVSQVKSARQGPPTVTAVEPLENELTIAEPTEEESSPAESKKGKEKRSPVFADDPALEGELDINQPSPTSVTVTVQSDPTQFRRPPRVTTAAVIEKASRWETFRTVGAIGFLVAILTAFGFLTVWLMRGSAEEQLAIAKHAYDNREFNKAASLYDEFAASHTSHEQASFARSRVAVARIRDVTENSGDVFDGLKKSKEVLPGLAKEPEFAQVRGELAVALVNVGQRMVAKAESAKTTEERKTYAEGIREQLDLINDPQYVAGPEKRQNEPAINDLEESRQRLLRNIQMNEDRVKAVAEMKAALEKSDVVTAYGVRQTVVRRHPQLQIDPELSELLLSATAIVKNTVTAATEKPQALQVQESQPLGKRIILTNSTGTAVTLNESRTLFVRAKSSIYGIDGATGKLKWRKYIEGRDLSEVVYVSDNATNTESGADGIITETSVGRMSRIAATTGDVVWALNFGGPVFDPQLDNNMLFVAERSGRVSCIDAETGAIRWSTKLPQPVAAGVSAGKSGKSIFVVGENSNIYSLSKGNGTCSSVFYLGHEPNTIHVSPLVILGRLLVFENFGPGNCQIRILAIGEDESLKNSQQESIRLQGHVVVSPQVEARRIAVVTNLGEVTIFELESISGNNVVTRMAYLVASEKNPKTSWPLMVGNDLWIAASQLTKLQIQPSRQQIVRDWVRESGDQFLGRPIKLEDSVVHVRNVRGTSGARITAMNKATGDPIWETNVGVPIVSLVPSDSSVSAITSQAALFTLGNENVASGRVDGPAVNAGRNQRQLQFDLGATNEKGYFVAVNRERGSQIAYYDPAASADRKLVVLASAGGEARPSGSPVWLNDGVAIPLDNGQLMAIAPATGTLIGSPIQPPLQPGQKVQWNTPTLLADGTTLIAANSDKYLVKIATGKQFDKLSEVNTAHRVSGDLASLQDTIFVPSEGEQSSYIEIYNGADLSRTSTIAVTGRMPWGLYAISDMVLAYSNREGLIAIGADGQRKWTAALTGIAPVGKPQLINDQIVLAAFTGEIYQINPQDGKISGWLKTGETISTQPLFVKSAMFVPGDDGNVLVVSSVNFEPYEVPTGN